MLRLNRGVVVLGRSADAIEDHVTSGFQNSPKTQERRASGADSP